MAERAWSRHYQDEWQSRAGDRRLPYWLRVAALAYGSHSDNGHARFKRGEIALVLGDVSPDGEIRPYVHVGRAIADAVTYGWLEPESFWGCLIVPAHAVKKGSYTRAKPCPIHVRRKQRSHRSVVDKGSRNQPPVVDSASEATAQWWLPRSTPSLCSVPPTDHREGA